MDTGAAGNIVGAPAQLAVVGSAVPAHLMPAPPVTLYKVPPAKAVAKAQVAPPNPDIGHFVLLSQKAPPPVLPSSFEDERREAPRPWWGASLNHDHGRIRWSRTTRRQASVIRPEQIAEEPIAGGGMIPDDSAPTLSDSE